MTGSTCAPSRSCYPLLRSIRKTGGLFDTVCCTTKPLDHIGLDLPLCDLIEPFSDFDSLTCHNSNFDDLVNGCTTTTCQAPCDILGMAVSAALDLPLTTNDGPGSLHGTGDNFPGIVDALVDGDENSLLCALGNDFLQDIPLVNDSKLVTMATDAIQNSPRETAIIPDTVIQLSPHVDSEVNSLSLEADRATNVVIIRGAAITDDRVTVNCDDLDADGPLECRAASSCDSVLEEHAYSFSAADSLLSVSVDVVAVSVLPSEQKYAERRRKNNEASRSCRQQRKRKLVEMSSAVGSLEADNARLKVQVRALEEMVERAQAILSESMLAVQGKALAQP